MNPRRYALIVAIVFAALAVLQLARAVQGWRIVVTTPWRLGRVMPPARRPLVRVPSPMRPAFPMLVLAGFRTQQTEGPATLIDA